jgi:phospholipid/cholesterol/gamma-HCH transport system substrate-binding protein
MRRVGQARMSTFAVGAIALAVIAVGTFLGFTKQNPFAQHFELKGAFRTVNDLKPRSPVRIAGVKVGTVTEVESIDGGRGAVITMRIDDRSIPIRKDARLQVKPRIFLEGNYFVDVRPGSPSQPALDEGETIPVQQTSAPVQFGQVLSALQSDTREDLKIVLREYGDALARGGADGFNRSIQYWEQAYKNSAVVGEAQLGQAEHDLSGYVDSAGAVAAALDRNRSALKSLITDFAEFSTSLAREEGNLSATIAELPRTLSVGHRALGSLNAAFPPFRRFVAAMRPAVRSSGPALDASLPLFTQLRKLVSRPELRGLVADLRPTVPNLVQLNEGSVPLQQQVRLLSSCNNTVIHPVTEDRVPDPFFPPSGPVYQEAWKGFPGLAGESRSFDANGQYVRSLAGAANYTFATGDGRRFFTTSPLQGIQPPRKPDGRPPLEPNVPCETQLPPDLRTRVQAPPEQMGPLNASGPSPASTRTGQLERQSMQAAVRWVAEQVVREGRVSPAQVRSQLRYGLPSANARDGATGGTAAPAQQQRGQQGGGR